MDPKRKAGAIKELELARQKRAANNESKEVDPYSNLKSCQKQVEFMNIREDHLVHGKEEIKRIQSVPLAVGQFINMVDENNAIVKSSTGYKEYLVWVLSTINRELSTPSASVALHLHSHALAPPQVDSRISLLSHSEKPDVNYSDIGGCDIQNHEIREAVELPLTHHELYKQIGIDPPRGVLLYGPPGTGKTMLAKAVENNTTAAFIRVNGSEFVQKYLGQACFQENAPAIIFIDEVDAITTARFDSQRGADREVERILMEILSQMDGFDQSVNVKIEFPLPDRQQKRLIFQVCTAKMNLSDEVDLEDYITRPNKISPAEIAAICQEAGMLAVRKNRYVILHKNFEKGYRTNVKKPQTDFDFYIFIKEIEIIRKQFSIFIF
uniref:AAA+ ATPase domain-containing protein n=1 Tax=Populus trichocarpa TaxID=3694 RepID=A0A2K1ZVY6_POPTR